MDTDEFQAVLERMLQLRLDCPPDGDGATAPQDAPARPAAADDDHAKVKQSAAEWTEVLVGEMASAASMDDARRRAAKILEAFGGAVCTPAGHVLADKDRELANIRRQNSILKKAVLLQHRRHVEDEEKGRELQGQVAQHREQVRQLEADKYVLSMHLRNAGGGASMPGNFNPEVF
ncbi:hypothetical protein CFC21_068633 [Triticum aestivum]|uniref:Uncharacterized protein n=2 Tax=Triticum aestivum TaxID=4565 RepID=A0A3B6KQ62_WHEAT|nr:hypothetical protein CFC21_068633 [Triticum aestivum]